MNSFIEFSPKQGSLDNSTKIYSPNYNCRKLPIYMVILHYTATQTAQIACDWLCNQVSEVSSHYLITENGHIIQMVDEEKRAWHAGLSSWEGQTDINSCSIGIEIQHTGDVSIAYPDEQITALLSLLEDILSRYQIFPQHILGHSDVAPGRKVDPGSHFPWAKLAEKGYGHYTKPIEICSGERFQIGDAGQHIWDLQSLFVRYGYNLCLNGQYDEHFFHVVKSFQMHYRPQKCDGILDISTIQTLKALIDKLK